MSKLHPMPHYREFTNYTPTVPNLYWDVYSSEQRIKALCMEYVKLTAFTDSIIDTVNDQYAIVSDMQEKLGELVDEETRTVINELVESGTFMQYLQEAADAFLEEQTAKIDEYVEEQTAELSDTISSAALTEGLTDVTIKLFGRSLDKHSMYAQCICDSGSNIVIGYTSTDKKNNARVKVYSKAGKSFTIDKAIDCGHFNDICYVPDRSRPYITAPMYESGTENYITYLRCWNADFTTHEDIPTPGLYPWAVSYDAVTETVYFVANGHIYKLNSDNTYEVVCDKPDFRDYKGQGMAVRDGKCFFCFAGNVALAFDMKTGKKVFYGLSAVDSWGNRKVGEYEGCEYDADGNLVCVNHVIPGYNNIPFSLAYCGYLKFGVPPRDLRFNASQYMPFGPHITTQSAGSFEFGSPNQLAFLHEAMTLVIRPTRVVVESGVNLDESTSAGTEHLLVTYPLYISSGATVKVDSIQLEGFAGLYVNGGVLIANCSSGNTFLYLTNYASVACFACWNGGTIRTPNTSRKDINTGSAVMFTTGDVSGVSSNEFTYEGHVLASHKIYRYTHEIG